MALPVAFADKGGSRARSLTEPKEAQVAVPLGTHIVSEESPYPEVLFELLFIHVLQESTLGELLVSWLTSQGSPPPHPPHLRYILWMRGE